jgi:pimeloyl-ACP methyl ester carboxylesterase
MKLGLRKESTRRRSVFALGVMTATFGIGLALPVTTTTGCLTSSINVVISEGGATGTSSGSSGNTPTGEAGVTVEGDDPSKNEANKDAITYRDVNGHPGCTTAGLDSRPTSGAGAGGPYTPAVIAGYKCAAKEYPITNEDKNKPIVLLIHGNSDAPTGWEKWPPSSGANQLAEATSAAGFRVYAIDFRIDKVDDPQTNNDTENAAQNIDHGWSVPIAEHFVESVMAAYPDRKISLVGFSLGSTVIRDALRRLHRANKKPFSRVKDVVLAAGANHGVSTFRSLCGKNPTMRGKVACELGDRTAYTPTEFHKPLNGQDGAWETPCADGAIAFGQQGVCGGNKVRYTTVVMKDKEDGTYQDEFVSEGSSKLNGATNLTIPTNSPDVSKYFLNGLLDDHYGAVRSEVALNHIMSALSAP